MYIYYIIFCFHSENQCPTTHPHIELSIPMVVVTPGYTGMPTLRTFGHSTLPRPLPQSSAMMTPGYPESMPPLQ